MSNILRFLGNRLYMWLIPDWVPIRSNRIHVKLGANYIIILIMTDTRLGADWKCDTANQILHYRICGRCYTTINFSTKHSDQVINEQWSWETYVLYKLLHTLWYVTVRDTLVTLPPPMYSVVTGFWLILVWQPQYPQCLVVFEAVNELVNPFLSDWVITQVEFL